MRPKTICNIIFLSIILLSIVFFSIHIGKSKEAEIQLSYISIYQTTVNGAKLTDYPYKVSSDETILEIISKTTATAPFKESGKFTHSLMFNNESGIIEIKLLDNGEIVYINNLVSQNDIYLTESDYNNIIRKIEK